MYELIEITANDYYIQSPAKIGIVKVSDSDVILIDSGLDKDAGKRALKILRTNGWNLKAIYNTHSHADHIGGNRYLQEQTGCEIYSYGMECDFIAHPFLEPISLYGAMPFSELRGKFLMAQGSAVRAFDEHTLPNGFELISLQGHSLDMVGFRTPDDTVFLADALSSKETLDKYKIGFIFDIGAYLETLEGIKQLKAKLFVPSHAQPCEDITELAQYNIDKVNEVADTIVNICKLPICFEDILQQLFECFEITMTHQQYVLVGSTVRSYLTWLKEAGRIEIVIENNKLLWAKAKNQ